MNMDVKTEFQEYVRGAPRIKTIIRWWGLCPRHYVKLKKDFQRQLFQNAIETTGCFTLLGKRLSVSRKTIAGCFKCKMSPQISTLLKIAKIINFPLSEIEKNIVEISNLKPKFPFKLHNPEGAEIRAAFLSDGHIPNSPIKSPMYVACEEELHWRLIELCKKVFGEFIAKPGKGHRTLQTRFPAVIGTALELAGVPRGDKRLKVCFVPRDIMTGSKNIQAAYLRRAFDDEGDVCFSGNKRAVRLTRSTAVTAIEPSLPIGQKWTHIKNLNIPYNTLLFGEKLLLYKLGINAKMYREGVYRSLGGQITAKWRICIYQQDNLRKFAENINFNLKNKAEKLVRALDSYKVKEFPNGEGEKFVIKILEPIYNKNGYVRFGDLGRELEKTGRTYDLAGRYLKILTAKNILKKVRYGVYVFRKNN